MTFLDGLNKEQQAAVKSINGPVMVIAGAGSGKTRVLTYRIAYLTKKNVKPVNILALTFTNKAAKEMKERISTLIGDTSKDIWMGTFHSTFAKILRIEAEKLGYSKNFTIFDTEDSLSLIKTIMAGLNIPTNPYSPYAIQSKISKAKNKLMYPEELENRAASLLDEKVAMVYKEYIQRLKMNNALDFDDLLMKPIELFKSFPEVLAYYQKRFSYILVDEYQDTNRAQYIVLKMLSERHNNICVVGDDAQSIYSFRGAEIQNIIDFQNDFKDHQIYRLEQNYRSTKTILAAADCVIKNNEGQIKKTLWTHNVEGEKIILVECNDEKDEGQQIIKNIENLIRKEKAQLNSFVILYRTNAQSRAIEEALRRGGYPYIIVGGIKFYERKEIKDILAYLKFISNPSNDESLNRIVNFPPRGIGDSSVVKLKEYAFKNHLSLFKTMESVDNIDTLPERVKNAVHKFVKFINNYLNVKEHVRLDEYVHSLIDELKIIEELKLQDTPESMARIENINEFVSGVSEFVSSRKNVSLEDYLQEVALITDIDKMDNSKNAITLMTVHAAKGLEFPNVFISGLEEGLFPHANSLDSIKDIEEERRLFYVAITRSMKKLFISYTNFRYKFGSLTASTPSRFLKEIAEEYIEKQESNYYGEKQEFIKPKIGPDDVKWIKMPGKIQSSMRKKTDSNGTNNYKIGSWVEHSQFGKGMIVGIQGLGSDKKVIVQFEDGQKKTLMVAYANLVVI
jgi:DNA helicase II / ATP-dependent DNA helicase PcrA